MNRRITQTLLIFLGSTVLLALFNSASLVTWAYDLDPGPLNDQILQAAEGWHMIMENLGLVTVTEMIRDHVRHFIDV